MSGGSNRARRRLVLPVLAALSAGVPTAMPALAQSAADLQWAQTILKEKGYNIGGRPNGQMTPQTGAALSAYQKAAGLPVTGKLDQATVGKMLSERQAKTTPTVNNLAQQKPGGSGPGQTPRQTREIVPRAATPAGKVESAGGEEGAGAAFSSDASQEPAPRAAPRANVTATTPNGEPVPLSEPVGSGSLMPAWMTGAVRYLVFGVLAVTVAVLGFAWWRSGRPSSAAKGRPVQDTPRAARLEPTFGGRREELTAGPRLTADPRHR